MVKATWRSLALCALMGVVAPLTLVQQAAAQIVIGGDTQPDVVVNWSVLDGLGQQRSLADLLKDDLPGRTPHAAQAPAPARGKASTPQGLAYKPFKAGAAVKPVKQAHAKPAAVKVADVAKPEPVKAPDPVKAAEPVKATEPVKAAQTPPALPAKPKMAEIAPVTPATPAAAPAPITKPVEPAKVEPPKSPEPAPAPVVAAAPAPTPTPVPAPVAPAPVVQAPAALPPVVQAPAVSAPAMPAQVASLPSAEPPSLSGGDTISLAFDVEDAKVGERAKSDLAMLIKRMQKDEDLNLQLLAYASGDDASKARRLSLSRALEVRKVLMDKGIRSTRIEVRALGSKVDGRGPADRVDAVLVGR